MCLRSNQADLVNRGEAEDELYLLSLLAALFRTYEAISASSAGVTLASVPKCLGSSFNVVVQSRAVISPGGKAMWQLAHSVAYALGAGVEVW